MRIEEALEVVAKLDRLVHSDMVDSHELEMTPKAIMRYWEALPLAQDVDPRRGKGRLMYKGMPIFPINGDGSLARIMQKDPGLLQITI